MSDGQEFLKGTNQYGHTGIFPSEHVQPIILPQDMEIVQDDQDLSQFVYQESCYDWEPQAKDLEAMLNSQLQVEVDGGNDEYINQRGVTICDYKALRDIELSFPKGAIIEHIVSLPFIKHNTCPNISQSLMNQSTYKRYNDVHIPRSPLRSRANREYV